VINLDKNDIQVNSFNDYYIIYLEGTFHDLTPHEYRFLTFTPHNILYEKDIDVKHSEYYYKAELTETEMVPRKYIPILKKKQEKHHFVTINSYNNSTSYAFLLPYYDASLHGTFRFELIVSKDEYKRIMFKKTLEDL
jgi:hypothetical protein